MPVYPERTVLWKLTLFQTLHEQECQNIFHFTNKQELLSDEHLISQTNSLYDEWALQIKAPMLICQSTQLAWVRATVTTLIPHNGPFKTTIIETSSGAQPNDSLPSYCAGIITLETGFAGRRNRGRLYIAGVPEDQSDTGRLSVELHDDYNNLALLLLIRFDFVTGNQAYQYVLYSHKDGDVAGSPTYAGVKRIRNTVAKRLIGTQRHRLIGHGT